MDIAEIDAPLTSRFGWYVGTAAGVVGLGLALAALLLLAHQQRTLRRLYEEVRAELKVSEEEYHTLFNSSPVALNVSRLEDGCFVDVNQAFVDLAGYSRSELIGRTSLEIGLFSAATRAGTLSRMRDAKIEATEVGIRRKSGEIRDCLIAADVLDLPGGRYLLISSTDITERKQAEQAQAFLSGIVTYSSDAIVGRDIDGHIVSWNASASACLATPPPRQLVSRPRSLCRLTVWARWYRPSTG
jgi:PAS domain S-box-containing protein